VNVLCPRRSSGGWREDASRRHGPRPTA
jgi:hypothetical protein